MSKKPFNVFLALVLSAVFISACRSGHFEKENVHLAQSRMTIEILSSQVQGKCEEAPKDPHYDCFNVSAPFAFFSTEKAPLLQQPFKIDVVNARLVGPNEVATNAEGSVEILFQVTSHKEALESPFLMGVQFQSKDFGNEFVALDLRLLQTEKPVSSLKVSERDKFHPATEIPTERFALKAVSSRGLFNAKASTTQEEKYEVHLHLQLVNLATDRPVKLQSFRYQLKANQTKMLQDQEGQITTDEKGQAELVLPVSRFPLENERRFFIQVGLKTDDQHSLKSIVELDLERSPESPWVATYSPDSETLKFINQSELKGEQKTSFRNWNVREVPERFHFTLNSRLELGYERTFVIEGVASISRNTLKGIEYPRLKNSRIRMTALLLNAKRKVETRFEAHPEDAILDQKIPQLVPTDSEGAFSYTFTLKQRISPSVEAPMLEVGTFTEFPDFPQAPELGLLSRVNAPPTTWDLTTESDVVRERLAMRDQRPLLKENRDLPEVFSTAKDLSEEVKDDRNPKLKAILDRLQTQILEDDLKALEGLLPQVPAVGAARSFEIFRFDWFKSVDENSVKLTFPKDFSYLDIREERERINLPLTFSLEFQGSAKPCLWIAILGPQTQTPSRNLQSEYRYCANETRMVKRTETWTFHEGKKIYTRSHREYPSLWMEKVFPAQPKN